MNSRQSTHYVPYKETNYFSNFICDYLNREKMLRDFYHRFPNLENFKAQIEEKKSKNKDHLANNRKVLVNVLKSQYECIKTSELTTENIESLNSVSTFTITTGHQLNLFTGPLYFLYKIISTINLTKELKAKYPSYDFVPIYWMASEDHDFEEINYFNFKGKKIQWNSKQTRAGGH